MKLAGIKVDAGLILTNRCPPTVIKTGSVPQAARVHPRLLVLDSTRIGSISATGQVKKRLFSGWPGAALLQIHAASGSDKLGISTGWTTGAFSYADPDLAWTTCLSFRPDIAYYRPHDQPQPFHRWAEQVIDWLGIPVVTHLMDDWMARLAPDVDALTSLPKVLSRSAACLSIGEAMTSAFRERYGVAFQPIANCADRAEWLALEPRPTRCADTPVVMRYVGALAEDMTRASVVEVAQAVDRLHEHLGLSFEVYTMATWMPAAKSLLSRWRGVSIHAAALAEEDYRRLLAASDILLVAYNFDAVSIRYIRYSIANKLPDCLAAGVPILAYGPRGVAAIDYLATHDLAEGVSERDPNALDLALRRLVTDPEYALRLGERGRAYAFEHHACDQVRRQFHQILFAAAAQHGWTEDQSPAGAVDPGLVGVYERGSHAHFDEVRWAAGLFGKLPDGILVDVGAHRGGALRDFLHRGWRIYAFEPDSRNRAEIETRFGHDPLLTIDGRALSDAECVDVPFFASAESTGISGLSAFRASHRVTDTVTTTTMERVIEEYRIERIDLLKIDAEGYDLMVLKGLPWHRMQPAVVIAEFEDRKTSALGYRFHDLARYLCDQDYSVWVSEWHPIVRYGARHDWRRLVPYPCHLGDPDAWGNLIAFKNALAIEALRAAAVETLTVSRAPTHMTGVAAQNAPKIKAQKLSLLRSCYYRLAHYLDRNHPFLARMGRAAKWKLHTLRRR